MDFGQAEVIYKDLCEQAERGSITGEAFQKAVSQLRLQDKNGAWWQIRADDGVWLTWNGAQWVEGRPGVPAGGPEDWPEKGGDTLPPGSPQTLLELGKILLGNFLKRLPQKMGLVVVIFAVVWILHSYLLVVVNDGFAKVTKQSLAMFLALQGGMVGGTLFWTLLSGVLSYIITEARRGNLDGLMARLLGTPTFLVGRYRDSGSSGLPVLLGGVAAGLLLGLLTAFHTQRNGFIANRALSALLVLVVLLAISREERGFLFLVARLTWSDSQRYLKALAGKRFPAALAVVSITGLLLGIALMVILPFLPFTGILAVLVAAGLAIFLSINKGGKDGLKTAAIILAAGGTLFLANRIGLAHDGGWEEYGGTLSGWIVGGGATRAVIHGFPPAVGAVIGALFPGLIESLAGIFNAGTEDIAIEGAVEASDPAVPGPAWEPWPGFGQSLGLPTDNPYTIFKGGRGPGDCHLPGLPIYWINTSTGGLVISDTFFRWEELGPPLDLTITYNSHGKEKGSFGRGWSFAYEWRLEEGGQQVHLFKGSGQNLAFTNTGRGAADQPVELQPPPGSTQRLLSYGDYWLYMQRGAGDYYRFDRVPGTSLARLTAIYDYSGNVLQLAYGPSGNLESLTDAAGRLYRFTFDQQNLCTAFIIPDGRQASFEYDGRGCLVKTVDLLGIEAAYTYDRDGGLVRMTVGREQQTTAFTYREKDGLKVVEMVTDAGGSTTGYEVLSLDPGQVRVTDPEGQTIVYHSRLGLMEAVVDGTGNYLQYTYREGFPISTRDRNGGITRMEYDARGNLTRITDPCGESRSFAYDASDNLVAVTNPLGGTWSYTYDERFNLTGVTKPSGRTQTMTYDQRGLLTAITNTAGVQTRYGYDAFGNLDRVELPSGGTATFSYDEAGLTCLSHTDARGHTTFFEHDANGRLTGITHPDGSSRTYGYNCCVPLLTTDENGNNRAYERDSALNITRYFDHLGNVTDYRYDRNHRPVETTDSLGHSLKVAYNNGGRPMAITDPVGGVTHLEYNPGGNLIRLREEGGQDISFSHDPAGRLQGVSYSPGSSYSVQRDPVGRIAVLVNGRGEKIGFTYDADGEIIAKQYNGEEVASFSLDSAGNLSQVEDASGRTQYIYNEARKIEKVVWPGGAEIRYDYDSVGNLIAAFYPGGLQVEYTYDSRNRLQHLSWGEHSIAYEFDPVGNLVGEKRSNGTESSYTYDANYHPVGVMHRNGQRVLVDLHYERDGAGNILKEEGRKPLAGADPGLSLSPFWAGYNQANQLLDSTDGPCTYDADGNLVAIDGNRGFRAAYDPENLPVELTVDGATTRFTYNGLGQRVEARVNGQVARFHYSNDGLLLFESDESGNIGRSYLYSDNRLAALVEADGRVYFYHFDPNGSTLALTGASGEIAAAYSYTAWGQVAGQEGNLANPFTYVGAWGVYDDGSDLYFMKKRWYDARIGRFIQRDPIGIKGGQNLYAYVGNNPLHRIDPEGTGPITLALFLVSFTAAVYTAGKAAQRFGEKNPVTRTLQGKPLDKGKTAAELQHEYFHDPDHGLGQVITTTADKALTLHPCKTISTSWSLIKAGKDLADNRGGDAIIDAAGAAPGRVGEIETALSEVLDALNSADTGSTVNPCTNP